MHHAGPPNPDAPPGANLERNFERVMEFCMGHPSLGGRVPFSISQELALTKLIKLAYPEVRSLFSGT